jgi:hypothetical protein
VEKLPVNAKTPERVCASGGRYAKIYFALGSNSRVLRGLLGKLPLPRLSATSIISGGVMLVSHPPLVGLRHILVFLIGEFKENYAHSAATHMATLSLSRRVSLSVGLWRQVSSSSEREKLPVL